MPSEFQKNEPTKMKNNCGNCWYTALEDRTLTCKIFNMTTHPEHLSCWHFKPRDPKGY